MLPTDNIDALRRQYETADAWRIRQQTHQQYTHPQLDFVSWVLKLVSWKGNEHVLDVGCGTGQYYQYFAKHLPDVTYYGVDYSAGMLKEHDAQALTRGLMQHLPFADGSFDVVMANHVLYLAPDVDAAIAELKRVLKPNGLLITTTSSTASMPQFRELFRRAILLVSPPGNSRDIKIPGTLHPRYSLENGSRILARQFDAVVRHDLPSAFVFPEVEPIMEYLESTRSVREPQLPENVSWDQVMIIMREQVTNLIASLNVLVVDKLTGVLMATNGGGFITEFERIRAEKDA